MVVFFLQSCSEIREVFSIQLSCFSLQIAQISLLLLVIRFSLPIPVIVLFEFLLELDSFSFVGGHSFSEVIIDIFFNLNILFVLDSLYSFYPFDIFLDLRVHCSDIIIEATEFDFSLVSFFSSFEALYRFFVHIYLPVPIFEFSLQAS